MDALGPDEDFNVWVGTNPATRKVAEIAKNPRAATMFFDPLLPAFVTLLGSASVVTDPAVKAQHWKDGWSPFYKNEHRGADFAGEVVPRRLEIVSEAHGYSLNAPGNWRRGVDRLPAKAPTP